MAPLPELQPAPETVTFCLQDGEIRSHGLPPGIRLRHLGESLVRCRQGALLEAQEFGVNLDPAAGVFRVGSLRIFAFEKPIRIDCLLRGCLRIHVFEVDALKSKPSGQPGRARPKGARALPSRKPAPCQSSENELYFMW